MISPNRKEGNDQSVSEYRNIVATQQDHALDRSSVYRQSENMQILAKNFHILEQFLQGFKNYQFQKQLVQLASTSNFKEQWQNKRKQTHQLKYSYFFRQNFWYLSISIFLLILQIVLIWFLSVFRVFGLQQNRSLFIFCFIIQVLDMGLKSSYLLFYKLEKQKSTFFQIKLRDWVDIYLGNFYCTVYALLGISQIISSIQTQQLLLLDLVAIGFSYFRIEDIQKDIKMIKSNLQFKNYIKLFHLMSTLIMIIHIFAVLMYFATNFSQNHYLDDVKIQQGRSWLNLYIYSFYFSGTTVLTVGYGDILPKNIIEIFIVLLMQIFGVVMIVYLNGEVGNILCSLRRQKENLQNDLSVLERLKASFKLSLETTQKIRQFLIDNRRADEENMVHQQKALLAKISSGLRQQATLTNHINIIRQSLFLLSNFSIKAHLCISNKLVHSIYSPNQIIFQARGQEKLFFVKKGEICFYISKKDSENENERKIIKTLSISNQDKENCNCFGYVSLIMGRPNRLKSFAKDFSSCYSIQKDQFIQAISCDNKDFEKYHEMRQNYMTERQPEKNEAEMFFNDREHYVCQVSKVIEEYLKEHHHSRRRNRLRQYKRRKLIHEINGGDSNVSESQSQIDSFPSEVKITETEKSVIVNNQNSCLTIKERKKKYQQFNNDEIKNSASNLVVQRKYAKRYCKNAYTKKRGQQLKESGKRFQQIKLKYSEPFEVGSSFSYFYTQFNIDMVMRKVNYYSKVLSIFTNMFQQTLDRVNANKGLNEPNGDFIPGSTLNIEKYRRQKDFLETINIKL